MQMPFVPSLQEKWRSLPADIRYAQASPEQLEAFEGKHGPIPAEYRAFLQEFGGGAVGSEWVDGIGQLPRTHAKFNSERGVGGWSMANVFVIGWDGAGNPIGIDASGAVVVEDHNFGEVHQLASSFAEFLARGLGHAL